MNWSLELEQFSISFLNLGWYIIAADIATGVVTVTVSVASIISCNCQLFIHCFIYKYYLSKVVKCIKEGWLCDIFGTFRKANKDCYFPEPPLLGIWLDIIVSMPMFWPPSATTATILTVSWVLIGFIGHLWISTGFWSNNNKCNHNWKKVPQ